MMAGDAAERTPLPLTKKAADAPAGTLHVVAVPYPGRGHVNPMMAFCRQLIAAPCARQVLITFVVTEEWLSLLAAADGDEAQPPLPPEIHLRTIPNVLPSEADRAANFAAFLDAVFTKMEAPFEGLLDELETSPAAIVADTHLPWAVRVGNRRGIPVASLYTISASLFSIFYRLELLPTAAVARDERRQLGFGALAEKEDLLQKYLPFVTSLRFADISSTLIPGKPFDCVQEAFIFVRKAQFLFFTSFYELEVRPIDALRLELSCPVYPVGPCIPYMMQPSKQTKSDYRKWLDSQLKGSVLYVSFGSWLSVSPAQLEEIAMGLLGSKVKFLWIARGESSELVTNICDQAGFIAPWCNQLEVLCHPSVGGFLSHCGWNSTIEAIFSGVPMLTFPIGWDQVPNSRLIVEEWKIGLSLKDEQKEGNLIGREDIARIVKKLMEFDDIEAKEIRDRCEKLCRASQKAVEVGGSSNENLSSFLDEIMRNSPA